MLIIPAGATVTANCDQEPWCPSAKAGAKAYLDQAQKYYETLSKPENSHFEIAANMTHGFVYENAEYLGEKIIQYLNE